MTILKNIKRDEHCPVCKSKVKYLFDKNAYSILKCLNCGLGFINPLPSSKDIEELYSKDYYRTDPTERRKGYPDYSILEEGFKKMYRNYIEKLKNEFSFTMKDKKILDVGCAYGFFLDVARESGASELWGSDITIEGENVVTDKGYTFRRGAFEQLEFPENFFDLIFMGDVFEHLSDPFKTVKKLANIIKQKGVVIITTLDFDSLFARLMGKRWRLLVPPEHIYYWTEKSLKILFRENNFEGSCTGYILYFPKQYLTERFKLQFGFKPFFIKPLPFKTIPVPSFDAQLCIFRKL